MLDFETAASPAGDSRIFDLRLHINNMLRMSESCVSMLVDAAPDAEGRFLTFPGGYDGE